IGYKKKKRLAKSGKDNRQSLCNISVTCMTFLTYTVLQAITEILLNIWLKTPHLELYKNNL
ncbi:hypothetical protein, partial [Bacteroides sp. AF04-22]